MKLTQTDSIAKVYLTFKTGEYLISINGLKKKKPIPHFVLVLYKISWYTKKESEWCRMYFRCGMQTWRLGIQQRRLNLIFSLQSAQILRQTWSKGNEFKMPHSNVTVPLAGRGIFPDRYFHTTFCGLISKLNCLPPNEWQHHRVVFNWNIVNLLWLFICCLNDVKK